MNPLEVCQAADLEQKHKEQRWLIDGLWADQAVGILGGEPKCCKSYLALQCGVAVAAGTHVLSRFAVRKAGRVLLFAAEDAPCVVRQRLFGLAQAQGRRLQDLDFHVILEATIRLDLEADRRRLAETVKEQEPRLLILDPFVRMHRQDENAAHDVAPMLAYLRELQRLFGCAVMLVHHSRKGASHARGGQALRGSSEFHAWGDSNLYLRWKGSDLRLSAEHRAAPGIKGLSLRLREQGEIVHLCLAEDEGSEDVPAAHGSPRERIEQALASEGMPLTLRELRACSRLRTETLCRVLQDLMKAGRVIKAQDGYQLAAL